jgi:hypothetical protein
VFWANEDRNKIFYDLAIGYLITLVFYLLVVRLPEYERRQRLKRSLERHYKFFREDCIQIMLLVADGSVGDPDPETLMQQDKFREYFSENVMPSRTRWDEFQNKLDQYYLSELRIHLEILREELSFVLNNIDIPKDEPFEFVKGLSAAIYSKKDVTLGYDETKPLALFLWNVFAGFDWITGYRKEDIVKKMIEAI